MMNELWEGYANQETVVLEDIDNYHVKMGYHLKIWADRYSFRGRVLYSSIVLRPKKIVVTSQYHPRDIWTDEKTVAAICDRFNIIEMEAREPEEPKEKPVLRRAVPLAWDRPPYIPTNMTAEQQQWWNLSLTDKEAMANLAACAPCLECYMSPCMCDVINVDEYEGLSTPLIMSDNEDMMED